MHDDTGSISIEFALCTLVAAVLAGILLLVVKSPAVSHALSALIARALSP
ncbi:DUF4244 domain-containing protein [Actinokineospora inagensis]|nr:DUF4244 domain-containing protein [Actinokineospora inagensis]